MIVAGVQCVVGIPENKLHGGTEKGSVGIKIRGNVKFSPLKFLGFLTDFWGARLGIKNRGFMKIEELTYVFEIGAGVW